MIVTLAGAIVSLIQSDAWILRPSSDIRAPAEAWSMLIYSETDGDPHHATFQLRRKTKSADILKTVQTFAWDKLKIDGEEGITPPHWDATVDSHGQILSVDTTKDENVRRMLSPLIFGYPEKAVAVGDKWSVELTASQNRAKLDYRYSVKSIEKIDGTSCMVVVESITESGQSPLTGNGTWWLTRVGKVVKFELKLSNWVVAMAGPEPMDVTIRGRAE